jgi:glucosamine--fructose-6-phosphate aminotransferase (isomerizing)
MCGIIGVTGADDALPLLLDGLGPAGVPGIRLGGRGHWSPPTSLWRSGGPPRGPTRWATSVGWDEDAPSGQRRSGVGHTRWATHGQADRTQNAHPHLDCAGRLALVHNGIIENHAELSAELTDAGHVMIVRDRLGGPLPT